MHTTEVPTIAAALVQRMRGGMSAVQVASEVTRTWRQIEASLTPILGPAGVLALYQRSLLLSSRVHPWLVELHADGRNAVDTDALAAVLIAREGHLAAVSAGDLLETFYRLLGSMIGPALARRLLPFMWQPNEDIDVQKLP